MTRAEHWEAVYRTKGPDQVSWFQAEARLSRQLIQRLSPDRSGAIIDIGGGASTLVDGLLDAGYGALTVLDLSPTALQRARERIGARAARVAWQVADVLDAALPHQGFDVWHDRAVFHFLTADAERRRYVEQVRHAVRPGGLVIVATFADDGPTRCSGLEVARYSPAQLHAEFGAPFTLVESHRELHVTPGGATQAFTYCACRTAAAPRLVRPTANRTPQATHPMKPRISVLTLAVRNLDAAVRFYRDGLGFATEGIVGTEFEHGAVAFFALQSSLRLALWPRTSLAHDAGIAIDQESAPAISLGHNVASAAEVDAVMAQAAAAGATIRKEAAPTFWGGYAGYFQDPDGYLWEVVWNPAMMPND